jgi:hypothetical protein
MRLARLIALTGAAVAVAAADEIPKGAHVLLRMINSVNTRTAQEGDYVYLQTATPIVVGERIVVPTGSYVQGLVTLARPSGRVRGRAQLALPAGRTLKFSPRLAGVDAGDTGQKVDHTENLVKQAPEKAHDAGTIAVYAGTGAAIGALADHAWKGAGIGAGIGSAVGLATALASRGHEVDLRQGSTLDVVFDRPVVID